MAIPAGIALLAFLASAEVQQGGGACDSAADCMLNGDCSSSKCQCHQGWTGSTCGQLDLLPAKMDNGYQADDGYSSWGGTVVKDAAGGYHIVAAKFAKGCGLSSWTTNSYVIHAVADSPLGPFLSPKEDGSDDVVHGTFGHNPVVFEFEPGHFALYQIGCSNGSTPVKDCSGGSPGASLGSGSGCDNPHWTGASGPATSAAGPWGPLKEVEILQRADVNTSAVWHSGGWLTNPSPVRGPDGRVYLAYSKGLNRAPGHKHIGVAVGDSWAGPFFDTTPYNPIFDLPTFENSEDPNLFVDPRGNFHLLTHTNPQPNWHDVSAHAFSPDGLNWTISPVAPYTFDISWEDGTETTVCKRERPQVLIEDGILVALSNGVLPDNVTSPDYTYTHVQGIRAAKSKETFV